MDPNPDYDASDEVEYGANWFAWILRGVYPPPAYPPVQRTDLSDRRVYHVGPAKNPSNRMRCLRSSSNTPSFGSALTVDSFSFGG